MANSAWPHDAVSGAPVYSGRRLRQTQVAPFVGGATASRPLGGRSGVRPGTSTSLVTATSTTWSVGAHAGVLDVQAAAEAGPYGYAVDSTVTGSVTAANASNPRVDVVYVQLADPAESDGTTTPGVTVGYLAGTAAATPVAPSAPARSMVLAQINVPKSGGGNPTVTLVAPYSVAAGGIIPVRTLAELKLMTASAGQHAVVTNDPSALLNGTYKSNGTAWVPISLPQALSKWGGTYARVPDVFPIFQGGQVDIRTSGTGRADWTFTTPFPNGITGVLLMPHSNSNFASGNLPVLIEDSLTVNGFGTFWAGKANSQVYLPFLAIGY